ncbi:MAG: aminotransferase class I/II-fold pyridoxal phosphate-dependent enzyme [Acidobacteriaceae bacterium]
MPAIEQHHHLLPATHLDRVGFSHIVSIRNKVTELRAAGKPVYGFHGGEPDFETPQPIKDAMAESLRRNQTRYAPSSGIEPLREAIAKKLRTFNGLDVTAEDVLVTVGGMQGLAAAFEATLDHGDEILVFSPYWTPIGDLVLMVGARPVLVPVEEMLARGIATVLEGHLTPATRAIYYNTPANPTGHVFARADAEQVAAFAIEHNLVVIADEAYEDIVYEQQHFSIASLPGMSERTITVFTLSKSYAMTGWRIGYVVSPRHFLQALQKVVLYTTNGVSTPTQWAALAAFAIQPDFFREKCALYRQRRDVLVSGLNELGLKTEVPGGSFYAFPTVDRIDKSSRKVADLLLEHASIATIPGVVFGPHGEGHLRFGFAVDMDTIQAGLASLRANLKG